MKKIILCTLLVSLVAPVSWAHKQEPKDGKTAAVSTTQDDFKARRKQIKELIKKYKKAPEAQKPAVKAELAQVVSVQVDAQMVYMKQRIADERANLDNWERKINEDEQNLAQVKAQRVEDLLSGEAAKKHKAAKKAWKKQMRRMK